MQGNLNNGRFHLFVILNISCYNSVSVCPIHLCYKTIIVPPAGSRGRDPRQWVWEWEAKVLPEAKSFLLYK